MEDETGARPPKSAQPFTTALILSLELSVLDLEVSFYQRLISWVILIASWASMRLDDIQCVLPQSLKLSRRGLTVRLARTKTTGPGKLHGQCHAFVNSCCSLTGLDWLTEGFLFWQADSLCYPRDYLVPHPTADWSGIRKKPPALANMVRMTIQRLGTPKLEDGAWRVNKQMLLAPEQMARFWTGHSARHFMPVITAAIGCPKADRDFLGRWAIGRVGSNAYMLTSRQIVERLQQAVVKSLLDGAPEYIEEELLDKVRTFADENGLIGHRMRRRHSVVCVRSSLEEEVDRLDSDNELMSADQMALHREEAFANSTVDNDDQNETEVPVYFITISRCAGFKRLHVVGACQIQQERCQETVGVTDMKSSEFDAVCKWCKKFLEKDRPKKSSDSEGSSDSSGESSSTNVETSADEAG